MSRRRFWFIWAGWFAGAVVAGIAVGMVTGDPGPGLAVVGIALVLGLALALTGRLP